MDIFLIVNICFNIIMIELVKIGVEGFDFILNGGIVKNVVVFISGNLGIGKSIFGF